MGPEALLDLLVTGILRGGLYSLMAVGLSLVMGVMNIPHFAHGEFYMLGAYSAYLIYAVGGCSPFLAILGGALAGLLAGAVVDKLIFYPLRRRHPEQWTLNTFLVTVGLSVVMQNAAQALWGSKFRGITQYWKSTLQLGSQVKISMDRLAGFLIAVSAIGILWLFLAYTRSGRAIRAVAQDETGALLVGVDINRIHMLTFALSSMLAAVAGATLLSINPAHPTMGLAPLYKSWYVVVLVGLGNVPGSVAGGFLVGLLETFSYYAFGAGWQEVVSLSVLIVILLFKPAGIFSREIRHA
jgi:branched-chain amino acid transport system permease protein